MPRPPRCVALKVPPAARGARRAADGAARGADVDVAQRFGALPELRRHLHDHVVLVQVVVDRRDLALAEGVVQRVVDLASRSRRAARRWRGRSADRLQAVLLLVGVDDPSSWGTFCIASRDPGHPFVQLVQRVALERVLVAARCPARPPTRSPAPACRNMRAPGDLRELAAAAARSPASAGHLALARRLQGDEHDARIGAPPAAARRR